jgi:YHS domain-containing protein
MKFVLWTVVPAFALAAVLSGCGGNGSESEEPNVDQTPDATKAEAAEGDVKAYPLDVCLVSKKELGSMGDPVRIVHEGQEIKFCCAGCVDPFKKNPDKYLQQMEQMQGGQMQHDAGSMSHEGHDH